MDAGFGLRNRSEKMPSANLSLRHQWQRLLGTGRVCDVDDARARQGEISRSFIEKVMTLRSGSASHHTTLLHKVRRSVHAGFQDDLLHATELHTSSSFLFEYGAWLYVVPWAEHQCRIAVSLIPQRALIFCVSIVCASEHRSQNAQRGSSWMRLRGPPGPYHPRGTTWCPSRR